MSIENLHNELPHAAKLDAQRRGELAELAFMRRAATFGFAVARPWGNSDRYDVIVRVGKVFWRVQVKSVLAPAAARSHYRMMTHSGVHKLYSAEEIDFLVAYIFPEDLWYVFPVALVEQRKYLWLTPGSNRSKYEQYREAWKLMGPTVTEPNATEAPAVAGT